jgi:adenylate cyclase
MRVTLFNPRTSRGGSADSVNLNRSHLVVDRRLALLCGLASAIITVALALWRPAVLRHVDSSAYDSIVRWAGTDPPGGQIVIVDIDERWLSALGQGRWRRDLVGRLIGRLRELGAATIALDVLFAEPDRFEASPAAAGIAGPEEPSKASEPKRPDTMLADVLGLGRVVLGYALTFEGSTNRQSACVLHPLGMAIVQPRDEGNPSPLFRASGAICSLPVLAQAAGASGFLNAASDVDGILRRLPLLIELDGRVYPGLALAAVMAVTGTRNIALRVDNVNAASLILDNRIAPLDGKGNLLLRYRGKKRQFRYVSAADVLNTQVSSDTFREKLVFVGATALGTREFVTTPLTRRSPASKSMRPPRTICSSRTSFDDPSTRRRSKRRRRCWLALSCRS